jgi:acetate CoA/acetoacetate CoA-transferase alpha subunit
MEGNTVAKIMDMKSAIGEFVKPGSTVMFGGFLGCNAPLKAIDEIVEEGIGDLTAISAVNSFTNSDIGLLFDNNLIKKFIASHIGTNKVAVQQYKSGQIEMEYYPQGTLIEKIRCAGAGLGGVLTPTGLGTLVEEGKDKKVIDGKEYILETALGADVAIIKGFKADKAGNILYKGTANSNPIMATAAKFTIAEVEEIVEVGEIPSFNVGTPGIFVDAICLGYEADQYRDAIRDMCKSVGIYK